MKQFNRCASQDGLATLSRNFRSPDAGEGMNTFSNYLILRL